MKTPQGHDDRYEAVVGLEIHAQLKTRTKIFCGCLQAFGAPANSLTCPVCLGLPGALPVLNDHAVTLGLKVALATHSRVASQCRFERKNYFYPDLPKNYQITQYAEPLARGGELEFSCAGRTCRLGIERMHLEEDAGKLLHDHEEFAHTLVDLNRAGVPLLEIVTTPDLHSGAEAAACLDHLRLILVYLEACDGNLEQGSLRCDANISVRPRDEAELGTKVEIKNMNSLRAVRLAVDHEIARQIGLRDSSRPIKPQTRAWVEETSTTRFMRSKELVHDYRYFPEPDLPPLRIQKQELRSLQQNLPELPTERMSRLCREYGLTALLARQLVTSPHLAKYFEATAARLGNGEAAAHWIVTELLAAVRARGLELEKFPVPADDLADLLAMVAAGTITGRTAKQVFVEMVDTGLSANQIVAGQGLQQTRDLTELSAAIREVLEAQPKEVQAYLDGKSQLLEFFVGEVMKVTRGRANPQLTRQLLRQELEQRLGEDGS